MFELRQDVPDEEVVAQARSTKGAGWGWFQVFAPHAERRSPEEAQFEAARLVDLLEVERWTLENAADVGDYDERSLYSWGSYGFLATPTIVGTIYTFRLRETSTDEGRRAAPFRQTSA
jgi:hypothetical protein